MTTTEPPKPSESESATTRFRTLWETSDAPPDLFAFLSASEGLSTSERLELVRIDQANRWRIGRPLSLKSYLKALPDFARRADLVRVLIDGDRLGRRRASEGGGKTQTEADVGGPSATTVRAAGDESTLIESCEHRESVSTRPDVDVIGPSPLSLESTAVPTRGAGEHSSPGSFTLDSRHAMSVEAESLRQTLEAMGFTVVRWIGAGGMGMVFEAYDQHRGEIVALKTMRATDPQSLVRFKQEFRSLADIAHPNLVSLFQMFAMEDRWFFTMELIEGTDFLTYVRVHDEDAADESSARSFDEHRLRSALIQLVEGVDHLHRCGKLHRDLKTTNVLAAEDGRVVVLDFGLTADLDALERQGPADRQIVGTAAHMSPEQSAGREASAASDWYSVGVMLFQALTQRLPFEGSVESVMAEKQRRDAPAPDALTDDLPADLVGLCRDLLSRDPADRPTSATILDRLRGCGSTASLPADPIGPPPIVGRSRHRRILSLAYESMKAGCLETVFLYGKSGIGRTTLLRAFLDDLERRGEAVVLSGRCYERESVPFKAFDALIDALVRYLKGLPTPLATPLLPPDVIHLARVFPVLKGVEGIAAAAEAADEPPDPHEVRLRAFTGLRELLSRIGANAPLVLAIDDLQWGDVDSAVLLTDLLYSPDPPILMFVASFRLEDAESSRFLQILRQTRSRVGSAVHHHDLAVEPLGTSEARELALRLLARDDATTRARAHLIARESAGNPLFIDELVKHVQAGGPVEAAAGLGPIDLDAVLLARIRRRSVEAGRLLDLVAASGRPINESILFHAGEFGAPGRVALAELRSARLVRGKSAESSDEIEVYHDRIRAAILDDLAPNRLAWCHARLAWAYEAAGGTAADPEIVAEHLRGAGEFARAGALYAAAAAKAEEALAFDHAARLYRTVIELGVEPDERRRLLVHLADALSSAGRGGEAAAAYLEAAESAPAVESLDLKRRASAQLLINGRVAEGMTVLRTILKPLGLSMPKSSRLARVALAWRRGRLSVRGLRFQERDESQITAEQLTRIDVCWSAVIGLTVIDPVQSAIFQTRGLALALEAGEPYRITRALAMEAARLATVGRRASRRVNRLITAALEIAERIKSPRALGVVAMVQGLSALLMGEWRRAEASFQTADALFRDRCAGVVWELDTVHILSLWSMFHLGDLAAFRERFASLQREARERGDLYAASTLSTFFRAVVHLADDTPDDLDDPRARTSDRPTADGFTVQEVASVRSLAHLDLYNGQVEDAWMRIDEAWPGFVRSTIPRIQMIRIQMNELRARGALAMAEQSATPEPFLRIVETHARRLDREPPCWCAGHVRFLRAGIAACRKDSALASHHLGEAARAYARSDMRLNECVMRLRMAEIRGGEPGRTQGEVIAEQIKELGIEAPERWARMTAPGFSKVDSGEIDTSF